MTPSGIKVLIADNSPVYKKMFAQAVKETSGAAVAHASDEDELLGAIGRENFELVILDAEFSRSGAPALIPEILRAIPRATILFTARPSPRNKALFAEAAAKGAAVRMVKPIHGSYGESLAEIKGALRGILKTAQKAADEKPRPPLAPPIETARRAPPVRPELALIASSTGGPQALEVVLTALSGSFPVPILVVQHMLPNFTEAFAQSLDKKSELKIKLAEAGELVSRGTVYIAPDGTHMALNAQRRISLFYAPPVNGIRPTADALFESVANNLPPCGVLAVVLTGMGRDGEKGLRRIKARHSCFCLAQSAKTCVVYGMPRAVVEAGLADRILDLSQIAGEMERLCAPAWKEPLGDG